jgi:hypothetical protein
MTPTAIPQNAKAAAGHSARLQYLDHHSDLAKEARSTTFGTPAPGAKEFRDRINLNSILKGDQLEQVQVAQAIDASSPPEKAKEKWVDPLCALWGAGHAASLPPYDEYASVDLADQEFARYMANAEKAFRMKAAIEENRQRALKIRAAKAYLKSAELQLESDMVELEHGKSFADDPNDLRQGTN